jgi:hypothetical protein
MKRLKSYKIEHTVNPKAKAAIHKAERASEAVHWRVSDIKVDEKGRILISNPRLAAIVRRHKKRGKHFFLTSTNTGNYCVVISSCVSFDARKPR